MANDRVRCPNRELVEQAPVVDLEQWRNVRSLAAARQRPEIGQISTTLLPSVPQKFVDADWEKVLKQGVDISDVYQTIQTFRGGLFVNYFNEFARQWQVYVQAEAPYRANTQA